MKAIYKKRLLKLAAFLRTVPKNHWNYSSWASIEPGCKVNKQLAGCGTHACALGWAFTMPQMKRAGFYLEKTEDSEYSLALRHKGGDAYNRAEAFFGLTQEEGDILFTGMEFRTDDDDVLILDADLHSTTAKQVAKRIEKFVKIKEEAR